MGLEFWVIILNSIYVILERVLIKYDGLELLFFDFVFMENLIFHGINKNNNILIQIMRKYIIIIKSLYYIISISSNGKTP